MHVQKIIKRWRKKKRKLLFLSTVGNKLIPTSWEPMGAGETPSLFPGKLNPFSSSSSLLSPALLCLSLALSLSCLYCLPLFFPVFTFASLSFSFSFYHHTSLFPLCLSPDFSLSLSLLFSVYPSTLLPPSPSFSRHPTSLCLLSVCLLSFFLSPFLYHPTSLSPFSISLSLLVPCFFSDVFRRREMWRWLTVTLLPWQ